MLLKSGLQFLLCYLQVALAATSYLHINSKDYERALNDGEVQSIAELERISSAEDPLVVIQFNNFNLLEGVKECGVGCRFLADIFGEYTNVLEDDTFEVSDDANVIQIEELPKTLSEKLYNVIQTGETAIVLQFTGSDYVMTDLDEYLDSAFFFLRDSLPNLKNLAIEIPSTEVLKASVRAHVEDESAFEPTVQLSKKPESGGSSDDGKLSSLWTEGLLSCLLVSLLLVWILVVAISWVTSLEISYGALEKPANPLKKNN
ncbi:LAFE_0D05776g1_1 [Lachancea fermentati]|uniref:LAFE_0D05776g1_1 n=1 Tax=Lachancea fermentati TaxID=4955 RepID=A0A1G4MBH0_LACFM|nr:LAFE_0D05776g1_1 [Lachancea fermentati]